MKAYDRESWSTLDRGMGFSRMVTGSVAFNVRRGEETKRLRGEGVSRVVVQWRRRVVFVVVMMRWFLSALVLPACVWRPKNRTECQKAGKRTVKKEKRETEKREERRARKGSRETSEETKTKENERIGCENRTARRQERKKGRRDGKEEAKKEKRKREKSKSDERQKWDTGKSGEWERHKQGTQPHRAEGNRPEGNRPNWALVMVVSSSGCRAEISRFRGGERA